MSAISNTVKITHHHHFCDGGVLSINILRGLFNYCKAGNNYGNGEAS